MNKKIINEVNDKYLLKTAKDRMKDFDGNLDKTFSQEEIEKLLCINTNSYESIEIE